MKNPSTWKFPEMDQVRARSLCLHDIPNFSLNSYQHLVEYPPEMYEPDEDKSEYK